MSGDIDISVRVSSLDNVDPWTKAGLMIRETLAADSRHVDMMMTADRVATFQRRTAAAAARRQTTTVPSLAFPYWVRLVRRETFSLAIARKTARRGPRLIRVTFVPVVSRLRGACASRATTQSAGHRSHTDVADDGTGGGTAECTAEPVAQPRHR